MKNTSIYSSEIRRCKQLMPTPSASAFISDTGRCFDSKEFEPLKLIGSGFFANVYQIKHRDTDKFMAFKVPKSSESMSRFIREIRMLKRLSHQNVVRLYGTCVYDGFFGCLTEYMDSGSLARLIERQGPSLEWTTAVDIAADVAAGLAHIHQHLILHRDLSSENVLLHREGQRLSVNTGFVAVRYRAAIADLGLSLDLRQSRSDRMSTVGNPFYTAPENLKNESPYNCASDVFSFGIILCEIITGEKNDPDKIPRTNNYGLNYKELKVKKDCPKWLHGLTCDCCMVYVNNRPSVKRVCEIIKDNKQYIRLWEGTTPSEEPIFSFSHSMDAKKLRAMSFSTKEGTEMSKNRSLQRCMNDSYGQPVCNRTVFRPICSYNSVDSFIDPRLVNLHKALLDPGYVDSPLVISMKNLDPRIKTQGFTNYPRKVSRCCSESDISLILSPMKQSPQADASVLSNWSKDFFDSLSASSSSSKAAHSFLITNRC